MVLPIIPVALAILGLGSLVGLAWYESLPQDRKRIADAHATRLAWQWYQKTVDELTRHQLDGLMTEVKKLMGH